MDRTNLTDSSFTNVSFTCLSPRARNLERRYFHHQHEPRIPMVWSLGALSSRLWLTIVYVVLLLPYGSTKSASEAYKRCSHCKLLAKTFVHGMQQTAKSHFAGGNTQWETEKLGRYATSETRLVEVLESVCKNPEKLKNELGLDSSENSEHKCHSLLEEQEETVENWYFHKQRNHPDLYEWLCVDTLRRCCPDRRFGPDCQPCPGDPDRPCFGRGTCNGEGTRGGTGKCDCERGYQGNLCRKCATSHYASEQNDTHVTCIECDVACKGGCKVGGPEGCNECKVGWTFTTDKGCTDVDECVTSTCDVNARCVNSPGSFDCVCVDGYKKENGICVVDVAAQANSTDEAEEQSENEDADENNEDEDEASDDSELSFEERLKREVLTEEERLELEKQEGRTEL